MVSNLVALHRGTVEAQSAGPGRGSTFVVRLPTIRQAHGVVGESVPPGATGPRRMRLLVVDDNVDAAESLALLLRLLGHEAWTAHDGQEALEQLPTVNPQVVFLDLGMPVMSGIEAAKRIRADENFRHLKLIALTGWGQERDRDRTAAAGFDSHLVKPAKPEDVERLLDSLVR